ncbi:MAG: group II intron reverse transcriptase domain-containing protein [Candidatus Pacebacteria bacterium]|nr:group II intron reverse transcriptase domain-containing protein [Candidatus Paceibacterota bacterium]
MKIRSVFGPSFLTGTVHLLDTLITKISQKALRKLQVFASSLTSPSDKTIQRYALYRTPEVKEYLVLFLVLLYMTIFTIEKLYKAYNQCLKNKKNTVNALKFEMKREKNIFSLLSELQSREYKISRHICFVVTEPSPREIFAGDFRDRVVHHLLCNEIQNFFEQDFIESSYANRKGKGTHKAVKKLKFYLVRGGINRQKLYFLKMDIKGFFRNVDKNILWGIVENKIIESNRDENWKNEVLWLTYKIIYHDPTSNYIFKGKIETKSLIKKEKSLLFGDKNKGLPLGNLTSQFLANVYLNEMDYFIKENLGFDKYIRYVDDFIIFDEDKERLEKVVDEVDHFLEENLKLSLCKDKTMLKSIEKGIDFLGYFVKPTHTLVRRKVVKRLKDKLYKRRGVEDGLFKVSDIPMIQSYIGHFGHANSFNLKRKLLED